MTKRETMEFDMRKVWNGVYRGISWEAKNWNSSYKESCWAHYIYLHIDRLPDDRKEEFWLKPKRKKRKWGVRVYYDYSEFLMEWHGGCTFYEKVAGIDGAPKVVQIGCDYQHLWDEGHEYDLDYVLSEVRKTIDSLWDAIPDMKSRCTWCSGWEFTGEHGGVCDPCKKEKEVSK